ncbi:hypothetical protein E3P92_00920 [Wallemia ichthyophaga]|nr:hypothetical protein E3P95_00873 [Wallemia ichthyophaga]TIB03575.1 hypothetical protein E3P94_01005 [Wallemia ichthyophaga]TIB17936.1 hypothetical protein E3P92_00920 [Wallemia ichthyophaga]
MTGSAIPETHLKNLHKYKYSGVDKSLCLVDTFSTRTGISVGIKRGMIFAYLTATPVVTFFPQYIAPNAITFSGLLIIIFNLATLLYYDGNFECSASNTCPPNWIYFTWAIGLFAYQSLDAIDGKQARRTGMAGPLGELFDHGCDALNTTLEVILSAAALNIGRGWWLILSQIATLANFYLSTWEEYHTGTLFLSVFSGPVEGIVIIVGLYALTGVYGPHIWSMSLKSYLGVSIQINELFMGFAGVGLLANIYTAYSNVDKKRKSRQDYPQSLSPLWGLLPFVYQTFVNVLWVCGPSSISFNKGTYVTPLLVFLIQWGLQFSHLVGLIILGHVAKIDFPKYLPSMFLTLLVAVDSHLPAPFLHSTEMSARYTLYTITLVNGLIWAYFAWFTVSDICDYLGIKCFKVLKRDEEGRWVKPKSL